MHAPKLVQLMVNNSSIMSEQLVWRIRASQKCRELLQKVPESEQRRYASEVYQALLEWLESEADSSLEEHYVGLGYRRAGQGVPLSQVFWAVSIARAYLWEYAQQECSHEEQAEIWGDVMIRRSLDNFFDHVTYFALAGYEKARKDESAALAFVSSRRSA